MSNNDSTAVVPQENGPNASTAENVPPMQEIQENTKEDCTGDLKEIVDSKPASTEVVTVETTTNDMEKEDKSENVNSHAIPIKEDSNTEVKDVPSKEDHSSSETLEENKPEEPVLKVDKKKEEESTKVDEENEISIVEETEIEDKDITVNNITEEAQTTGEVMDCSENKEDKSENEEAKSEKEEIKSEKEEAKSEKEEVKSEKEEDVKTDTSQSIEEKPSQETASLLDNTSNLSIDDEKKETESTPRSRPRRNIPTNEDVSKEEPTTGKRGGRRSKVVRETNNDDEETNTVEKTPTTGRRGRKTAKIQEKVDEEENVDVEPMEVDEDVEAKTPSRRGAKKANQKSTPVVTEKKRGTKRKNNDEVSKDNKKVKSDDDAYNIDNLDEHPEISESFKLERQSNGGAKFLATSTYKRGRFSEIEKAAKERNADTLNGDSEDAMEPSEKKSISLLTLSDKKLVSQIDDEKSAEKKGLNTPVSRPNNKVPKSTSKTPKSVVKNSVKKPITKATPATVKNTDSSDFMLPDLTEDSQFEADTKFESGEVNPYARVYAYFSGVCYAAISTGKSTVSSFEVQFIDDKVMKYIARGGLYRLQELAIGLDVEFMDGEETFEGTIKKVPDSTKVSDFCKANFTIEKKDDDGKKKDVVVSWDKIILDKSVLKNVRNVETEIKTMGKTPKRKNQL